MFKIGDKVKLNLNEIIPPLRNSGNISKRDRKYFLRVHILPYTDKMGTVTYINPYTDVIVQWSDHQRFYYFKDDLIKM